MQDQRRLFRGRADAAQARGDRRGARTQGAGAANTGARSCCAHAGGAEDSFAKGDVLYVAAFEDVGAGRPLHWIYARTARSDEEGYVPSTYLVRVTREAVEIETVRYKLRKRGASG